MDICVVCRDKTSGFQPFWPGVKQCSNCGHCMPDMDARSLNLKVVYGDGFFSGDETVDYLRDRSVFEKQFRDRLKDVKKYQSGGDLVEIGCAYGFFLAVAQESYRAQGFDIAEGPVVYARECLGVDARCEDFLDASSVLILGATQLITLAIVGQCVGLIYEVKRRPLYLLRGKALDRTTLDERESQ